MAASLRLRRQRDVRLLAMARIAAQIPYALQEAVVQACGTVFWYKRPLKALLGRVAGLAGVALATPGSGITPTTYVDRNTMPDPVHLNTDRIQEPSASASDPFSLSCVAF
jgi:hypothetical protein